MITFERYFMLNFQMKNIQHLKTNAGIWTRANHTRFIKK